MRIARILTRLNLGGPARQVLASDPLLLAGGHEIRLFAGRPEPGEGDLCERAKERGIDVRRVKSLARGLNPLRDLKGRSELAHELAAFDPDVIHTHAAKAGALGRSAGWAATRAPLVHTFHGHVLEGYFPRVVSRRMAAFERRWARRCSRVIAVSERTAEDLVRLDVVERREVEVVPPGIELDEFARLSSLAEPACLRKREARGALELDPSAFVVLFLGRLAPIKRPTLALAAFAKLHERIPEARMIFAGDGRERVELERACARLPEATRDAVRLLGAVEDVLPLHAASDVCLSSSRNEGLPVALIEAAAAARPSVAIGVGGIPELVVDGVTGLCIRSDATDRELVEGLSGGLLELALSSERRAALGQAARERALTRHGAGVLAGALEAVYTSAVREGRRQAS